MKLLRIALCLFMLGTVATASAQVDAYSGATQQVRQKVKSSVVSADKIAKTETARLKKALSLTTSQKNKVQAIVKKYASLKHTANNLKKMDNEILAILSDSQKAKYEAYKKSFSALRRFSGK